MALPGFEPAEVIKHRPGLWGRIRDAYQGVGAPGRAGRDRRRLDTDVSAGVGSVDHLAVADVDADVGDIA